MSDGQSVRTRHRMTLALAGLVMLLTACAALERADADFAFDGLEATGIVAGSRVVVSDGAAEALLGDCDPVDGVDDDLCINGLSVDGQRVAIIIENPGALLAETNLVVAPQSCARAACDQVRGAAIVRVRVGSLVLEASGGSLEVRIAGPSHAADFRLEFADGGDLSGHYAIR